MRGQEASVSEGTTCGKGYEIKRAQDKVSVSVSVSVSDDGHVTRKANLR